MVAAVKLRTSTLPCKAYSSLPTKSPQQQHPNPSTSKNFQLVVMNTPTSANTISASYLHPNVWFAMLNMSCVYLPSEHCAQCAQSTTENSKPDWHAANRYSLLGKKCEKPKSATGDFETMALPRNTIATTR